MEQSKKKVLIVEDEDFILQPLADALRKEGLTVFTASDGDEGYRTAMEKHPDLILLDIIMPVMDGMTMLRQLRIEPWGQTVPVIILTNVNDYNKIAESLASGAYDYLVKTDWHIPDVVQKVKDKLAHPTTPLPHA